mmetsp:Transcript_9832/g.16169  ORF Transcript_9832/g.16169 Transcript_9832/m.16169 type:complete len:252 (-) Transcript_9832:167-922(-)
MERRRAFVTPFLLTSAAKSVNLLNDICTRRSLRSIRRSEQSFFVLTEAPRGFSFEAIEFVVLNAAKKGFGSADVNKTPKAKGPPKPQGCDCFSGKPYKECCGPFHWGYEYPDSPKTLLLSRFAAYVRGVAEYVILSTHPDNSDYDPDFGRWAREVKEMGKSNYFSKPTILAVEGGGPEDSTGIIEFEYQLRSKLSNGKLGPIQTKRERSTFVRDETHPDRRWLWRDFDVIEGAEAVAEPKAEAEPVPAPSA